MFISIVERAAVPTQFGFGSMTIRLLCCQSVSMYGPEEM